jgi:hypothetical protein
MASSLKTKVPSTELVCIAWGSLAFAGSHEGCPVLFESAADKTRYPAQDAPDPPSYPAVCPCDCADCNRAWWADGRPIVRGGKIVRNKAEAFPKIPRQGDGHAE